MTQAKQRQIPDAAITLSAFSLLQANTGIRAFAPSWINVWEAILYKKVCHTTGYHRWLFQRFGVDVTNLAPEAIRQAHYREMLQAMEVSCKQAMGELPHHVAAEIRRGRTALVYFDSWGETSLLEGISHWRDALSVDMLPRSIAKEYGIKDFSCKLRGERSSFLQGLRVAQDRLNSGGVDTVMLCGQFRAIPVLVLSQALQQLSQSWPQRWLKHLFQQDNFCQALVCHYSIERTGCFILRKAPQQGIDLHLTDYFLQQEGRKAAATQLAQHWQACLGDNSVALFGATTASVWQQQVEQQAIALLPQPINYHALNVLYGDSGCLNPALALLHMRQDRAQHYHDKHAVISASDGQGSVWLLECWNNKKNILP